MEGTIITKKGMKLLLKILAAEGSLHFSRAAVGTGTILTGYDPASMLDLVQYQMDGAISKCETAGDVARITMQLCSEEVENGFIITEAGIFALDPDEGEILYAYIDLRDDPQYMYAKGTKTVKFIEITLDVLIEANMPVSAYINPNSLISRKEFENHAAEQQEMIDATYRQATGYTDQKVADLINGAPSTLDTLSEIANAMEKNADVVAALEAAIGLKADATEFDTLQKTAQTKNGDAKDNIVSFDSKDGASPTGWLDWVAMKSKETLSGLLSKVAVVANNVRWLYKMLGTTDISAIGGGTVTGALHALNTGIAKKLDVPTAALKKPFILIPIKTSNDGIKYVFAGKTNPQSFTFSIAYGSGFLSDFKIAIPDNVRPQNGFYSISMACISPGHIVYSALASLTKVEIVGWLWSPIGGTCDVDIHITAIGY